MKGADTQKPYWLKYQNNIRIVIDIDMDKVEELLSFLYPDVSENPEC